MLIWLGQETLGASENCAAIGAVAAVVGQDALARAVFKAAVHHSRSSISVPAGASNSASPASTSPLGNAPREWRRGCGLTSESGRAEALSRFHGAAGHCGRP